MSESYIGQWLWRLHQKAHLVESEITDRLVMKCGRQMALETKHGGPFYRGNAAERCAVCLGRQE